MDTISENETLQTKLQKANGSFVGTEILGGGDTGESMMTVQMSHDATVMGQSLQIVKAEKDRDEHKWRSERLIL